MPDALPPGITHHARARMVERIGRDLTREEWRALVLDIIDGRAVLVRRNGDGKELYAVQVGSITVQAWWAPQGGCVTTIMTPEMGGGGSTGQAFRDAPLRPSIRRAAHYAGGKKRPEKTDWIGS